MGIRDRSQLQSCWQLRLPVTGDEMLPRQLSQGASHTRESKSLLLPAQPGLTGIQGSKAPSRRPPAGKLNLPCPTPLLELKGTGGQNLPIDGAEGFPFDPPRLAAEYSHNASYALHSNSPSDTNSFLWKTHGPEVFSNIRKQKTLKVS